ncbi:glycyl-tRNA synthetase [Aspergillus terreus]|uniref:Guanine nucleotide-exchange factor SEC12 n=1 Tax=Aspergillus terreus TaxID=33178 RepID=A0A5M3ZEC1_ASPTE|nr:hypothetical protein ATETN484_0018008300 [Aspergillus terreus]GFF21857.1 glycyl-tRNA synthetase [Aspergillus terreus]
MASCWWPVEEAKAAVVLGTKSQVPPVSPDLFFASHLVVSHTAGFGCLSVALITDDLRPIFPQALLNTSKRNEISEVVDIELSRDEDSVTSLAAVHASDESIVALAGINSSVAEQKRDNNQHLRSFRIDYPPRKRTTPTNAIEGASESPADGTAPEKPTPGKTTPLSRASLFRTKGDDKSRGSGDTYQRILRLSPWKDADTPRVAAIATGLAPSGEIVFFHAVTTPSAADVIGRIRLDSDEEAEDVDITDLEEPNRFQVAYTNGVDVFTCQISSETRSNAAPDVKHVYSVPLSEKGGRKTRPKFRALRFLSPTTLLLLQNAPDRKGCELVLLELHDPALSLDEHAPAATVLRRKKLRSSIKIGLGLDVCSLGANPAGQQQTVVAVSGSDQSIEILTLEHDAQRRRYTTPRSYTTLRDVHPFSMTKLCFSHYAPPALPVSPETPPQYIKLASVSMGNTVVVHTFPLAPVPPASRSPRYTLVPLRDIGVWSSFSSAAAAAASILFVCLLIQAFAEIRGVMPPRLGVTDLLPPDIRDAVARPYIEPGVPSYRPVQRSPPSSSSSTPVPAVPSALRDILHAQPPAAPSSIVVHCSRPAAADTPAVRVDATSSPDGDDALRRWEDLSEHDQAAWKKLLADADHWGLDDDEARLHGVRFGERCPPGE